MRGRKVHHLEEEANTQLFVHEMMDMFCKAHRRGMASFSFAPSSCAPDKSCSENDSLNEPWSSLVLLSPFNPGVSVYTVQGLLESIPKCVCPIVCKLRTHVLFCRHVCRRCLCMPLTPEGRPQGRHYLPAFSSTLHGA